jgi:uncharacterized protein (PEP-CTERM system associated)
LLYPLPKKCVAISFGLRATICAGAFGASLFSVIDARAAGAATSPASQAQPVTQAGYPATAQAELRGGEATVTPPSFDWGAYVGASESYVSNGAGIAGGSKSDFLSTLTLGAYIHDRSRLLSLDANYSFGADFYARGTSATQIYNNLQLVGALQAIPDYLTINAKAFASPTIISNIGIATAGNRVVANGYTNSYGYTLEPDLRLRFGSFANSETIAIYGSTFFSRPAGTAPIVPIPGLFGPENTNTRGAIQTFRSGEDFDRLNWSIAGQYEETKRKQGLFSDKSGVGTARYAISHEFSLLATIGYDAITNTVPLSRNLSGLVALGGFALTFGENFSLQVEAGRKYNDASFEGSLRYNLTPRTSIVGSAADTVSTPEGQLLNSLTNLTATPTGTLTSTQSLLGDGTPSLLAGFDPLAIGNLSFDQNIARYQTVSLSFLEDLDRNHAALSVYGTRRTILSGIFLGPPTTNSWGTRMSFSRNLNPLLLGTIDGTYQVDQELGGTARTFEVGAELSYAVTRNTQFYFQTNYLDRQSSAALRALSPLTGSLSDYKITIGVNHTL